MNLNFPQFSKVSLKLKIEKNLEKVILGKVGFQFKDDQEKHLHKHGVPLGDQSKDAKIK